MPVMGVKKFERFFRSAGGIDVDRNDLQRYLDFGNDVLYDLLIRGRAVARANVRDVIEPWDLPITAGIERGMHRFREIDVDIELRPILAEIAARPPLDATVDETLERELPEVFGGVSVALAQSFNLIDAELKAVHSEEWERAFNLFRLVI
ncbi:MAG TPA: DUF1931 family protein [Streptosporangiaceae bacterium]|jgi:hypothetical protein